MPPPYSKSTEIFALKVPEQLYVALELAVQTRIGGGVARRVIGSDVAGDV
jgi:hypothetical protein